MTITVLNKGPLSCRLATFIFITTALELFGLGSEFATVWLLIKTGFESQAVTFISLKAN